MLPHRDPLWPVVLERAAAFAAVAHPSGATLAAFERQVLFNVEPSAIPAFVAALRRRKAIWTRRQGSAVRVFARRPQSISGVFRGAAPVDRFMASATLYISRIAADVAAREAAKAQLDALAAQEARDRLDASGRRLVAMAIRHAASGMALADCRGAMWSAFNLQAMEYVATIAPALALDSDAQTIVAETKPARIAANLDLTSRVGALVRKAAQQGTTKTALCRGIRPAVSAANVDAALASLTDRDEIEARIVRIRGSGRSCIRFFAVR